MLNLIRLVSVFFLFIFVLLCPDVQERVLGQTGDSSVIMEKGNETESNNTSSFGADKIDRAGDTLTKGINSIEKKRIGKWFNRNVFAGITWLKLCVCLGLLVIVLAIGQALKKLFNVKPKATGEDTYAGAGRRLFFRAASGPVSLFIWGYGVYLSLYPLYIHFQAEDGSNLIHSAAQKTAGIIGITAIVWFLFRLIDVAGTQIKKWTAASDTGFYDMKAPIIRKGLRIFILAIGIIIIIQNLTDIKIGPLLASLGIGGLAIALAAKESIANFFGTLTIMFDRPFKVGERIIIDSHDGVVESVGFRSTRIRTLTGHLLTIPNEKVISSPLENIGRRPHIRWTTNIGITYDTPPDQVEKAVQIVRDILKDHEGMDEEFPPQVYFNRFNDWNLNIAVFAWYHPPVYWDYQAWVQKTCLEIMRRFNAEGIEFAFPSQTVYLSESEETDARC